MPDGTGKSKMESRCQECGHHTDQMLPWILHGILILTLGWWACGGTGMAILLGEYDKLLITVPALFLFYGLLGLVIKRMDYCPGHRDGG